MLVIATDNTIYSKAVVKLYSNVTSHFVSVWHGLFLSIIRVIITCLFVMVWSFTLVSWSCRTCDHSFDSITGKQLQLRPYETFRVVEHLLCDLLPLNSPGGSTVKWGVGRDLMWLTCIALLFCDGVCLKQIKVDWSRCVSKQTSSAN